MKILIISPFFGTSGSEVAIRNLMNCLSQEIRLTITTIHTGLQDFEGLKPEVEILSFKKPTFLKKLGIYLLHRKKLQNQYQLINFLERKPQDIIFLNTLLAINHVDLKVLKGRNTILYVHETESMLVNLSQDKLKFILEKVDLILCSSRLVKDYFKTLGRNNYIEILYPAVNFEKFIIPINSKYKRREFGLNSNDFIWMMSGPLLLNKNPAAFLKAAKILSKEFSQMKFLWVGATNSNAYEIFLRNYIEENKLNEVVKIIPRLHKDEYYQYLNIADGFVLTSLSESFSLAALEAASFCKPVVCFPCGGVLESVPENMSRITENFSETELVDLMKKEMSGGIKTFIRGDAEYILKNHQFYIAQNFEDLIQRYFRLNDKKT